MPLIIFLIFVMLFAIREYFERKTRDRRYKSWEENQLNGYREYLYAWNYYWEEIVPAVYEKMREQKIEPQRYYECNPGFDVFNSVAEEMYGERPEGYAVKVARQKLIRMGLHPYSCTWHWNEWEQKPGESWVGPPLHNLLEKFHDPLLVKISNNDPVYKLILSKDDKRRNYYIDYNGRWKEKRPQAGGE